MFPNHAQHRLTASPRMQHVGRAIYSQHGEHNIYYFVFYQPWRRPSGEKGHVKTQETFGKSFPPPTIK